MAQTIAAIYRRNAAKHLTERKTRWTPPDDAIENTVAGADTDADGLEKHLLAIEDVRPTRRQSKQNCKSDMQYFQTQDFLYHRNCNRNRHGHGPWVQQQVYPEPLGTPEGDMATAATRIGRQSDSAFRGCTDTYDLSLAAVRPCGSGCGCQRHG